MTTPDYALGSDDDEIERLQAQAAIIAEPTAVLFRRGGVAPGMRVLDLGSGPGDVSFLVADIVGPDGHVLGLERDPAQLDVAGGAEMRWACATSRSVRVTPGPSSPTSRSTRWSAGCC